METRVKRRRRSPAGKSVMARGDKFATIRKAQDKQRKQNKENLLLALISNLGNVSIACENVGVSRDTYYNYRREDPDFKTTTDDVGEKNLDFTESKLLENITSGKEASIIFMLKTRGKGRGYVEKRQLEHTGKDGGAIEVKETVSKQAMASLVKKFMK